MRHFARRRRRVSPIGIVGYGLACVYAVIVVVPIYYVIVSSFKKNPDIFGSPLGLPGSFSLGNYFHANDLVDLGHAIGVSAFVVVGSGLIVLALALPASYALARIPSRITPLVVSFFGIGFLIPAFALLIPVFLLAASLGLLHNPIMLVLFYPATRLPFSIIVLTTFFRRVPREIEESATMDGAGHLQILRHVLAPIILPGIVTVALLNFIEVWNEYLFAFVLLDAGSRTVQVAVPLLASNRVLDQGLLAAGVVVSMLPVVVVFVFFSDRLAKGLMAGAVKG